MSLASLREALRYITAISAFLVISKFYYSSYCSFNVFRYQRYCGSSCFFCSCGLGLGRNICSNTERCLGLQSAQIWSLSVFLVSKSGLLWH